MPLDIQNKRPKIDDSLTKFTKWKCEHQMRTLVLSKHYRWCLPFFNSLCVHACVYVANARNFYFLVLVFSFSCWYFSTIPVRLISYLKLTEFLGISCFDLLLLAHSMFLSLLAVFFPFIIYIVRITFWVVEFFFFVFFSYFNTYYSNLNSHSWSLPIFRCH